VARVADRRARTARVGKDAAGVCARYVGIRFRTERSYIFVMRMQAMEA